MGGAKSSLLVMPTEVQQLHLAVMRNDIGAVRQLAPSVDVDFPWHSPEPPPSLKDGCTPLGEAVSLNHRHVVEVLLKCGASVNKPDNFGCTPLHKAAYHGRHILTELLISMGADVGWVDHNLNTPLHICVQSALVHNSLETVRTLLRAGAAVNQVNRFGKAPLHYAALWALPDLCLLLIQANANLDQIDLKGKTPLYSCIHAINIYYRREQNYRHSEPAIKVLIGAGCDPLNISSWLRANQLPGAVPRPESLLQLCRAAIQHHLPSSLELPVAVSSLPLPLSLQEYLSRKLL